MQNWWGNILGSTYGSKNTGAQFTINSDWTGDWKKYLTNKRASGGPVNAGIMYQVNEEGVETFILATNGYILTAGQTKQALASGNQSPQVTVNVINQTGTAATVKHDEPKWNGNEWVMTVWLNGVANNVEGSYDFLKRLQLGERKWGEETKLVRT